MKKIWIVDIFAIGARVYGVVPPDEKAEYGIEEDVQN
jgi:hypothetical protein